VWSTAPSLSIANSLGGTVSSSADLSGSWRGLWDDTNLYFLVQVTDDTRRTDSPTTEIFNDDSVEIALDIGNEKTGTYAGNDVLYLVRAAANAIAETKRNATTGVVYASSGSPSYTLEIRIPWSTLGTTPAALQRRHARRPVRWTHLQLQLLAGHRSARHAAPRARACAGLCRFRR
jgi:Carbohydrate family 9 binding domain-like